MKLVTVRPHLSITVWVLVVLGTFVVQASPQDSGRATRIAGASLLSGVVEMFLQEYTETAEQCDFILTPSSTGEGFQQLASGAVEMVMATRRPNQDEEKLFQQKRTALSSKLLGYVSLAVVVNKSNPLNSLTLDQLRDIYAGSVADWRAVGGPEMPIRALAHPVPETGSGQAFQQIVLDGESHGPGVQEVLSLSTLAKILAKDVNAIGYLPTSTAYFRDSAKKGMKVISLRESTDGPPLFPKYGAVKKSFYPAQVPFYLYWTGGGADTRSLKGLAEYVDERIL